MKTRSFRSFAKINLGLEVIGKLPGGYHELKTIFATLSLHDVIHISPRRGAGIIVQCDHRGVPDDESNLAHRAAALMQEISGLKKGVSITITKRIAIGGGLGGGSSNAATVLRALDSMWGLGLGVGGLLVPAKRLGADVPYFLVGGPALGLCRGDEIRVLDVSLLEKVVLVQGSGGVSTARVFQHFAALRPKERPRSGIDAYLRSMEMGDKRPAALPTRSLRNDLEGAALDLSDELARTAQIVHRVGRSAGASHTAMSGTGSSFFLLFEDGTKAKDGAQALRASGLKGLRCSFLSRRAFLDRFEVKPTDGVLR